MNKLLMPGAAIAAALTLAACGGGGSGAATAKPSTSGKTVSVKQIGGAGNVLVDSTGQALYASDQETAGGKVLCTGACNSFWTPLTIGGAAPKGSSVPGKVGVVKRPDGARQVTYNGKLLYSFTEDQPGEATGDGFTDAFGGKQFTWHVVSTGGGSPGGTSSHSSPPGY